MAAIRIEIIQSAPFLAGNVIAQKVYHQDAVNAFLATIPDPQNVLALDCELLALSTNYVYKTVITYYQP